MSKCYSIMNCFWDEILSFVDIVMVFEFIFVGFCNFEVGDGVLDIV